MNDIRPHLIVIPANAGIQLRRFGNPERCGIQRRQLGWIPAFAGMTNVSVASLAR